MFGRFTKGLSRHFAEEVKSKMQVTLRSPYKTYLQGFEGFSRIVARTSEGTLVIQSKQPPAAYVLLPGSLKVLLTEDRKDTTGEFVHSGGFAVIHPNNTVDINLVECFDKNEVTASKISESEFKEGPETATSKYVERIRNSAKKDYLRHL